MRVVASFQVHLVALLISLRPGIYCVYLRECVAHNSSVSLIVSSHARSMLLWKRSRFWMYVADLVDGAVQKNCYECDCHVVCAAMVVANF